MIYGENSPPRDASHADDLVARGLNPAGATWARCMGEFISDDNDDDDDGDDDVFAAGLVGLALRRFHST